MTFTAVTFQMELVMELLGRLDIEGMALDSIAPEGWFDIGERRSNSLY